MAIPSSPVVVDTHTVVLGINTTVLDRNSTFTWLDPVTFNLTISSTVDQTLIITLLSTRLQSSRVSASLQNGTNYVVMVAAVLPMALPGDDNVTFTFTGASSSATETVYIWVGTSVIFLTVMLICILIIGLVIISRFNPKAASSPGTPGSATVSSSSSASEDDMSTMTYVDQSTAPAGKIFCPECKKIIEEGSIFCPECGTRIPRYLRYHP